MRVGFILLTALGIAAITYPRQEQKPPSTNPASILSDAQSLYRRGSCDQALARYNEALKADADSGEAYAGIIRCYLKQDRLHEADDTLRKALNITPGNVDFKVAEAEMLFRQGEIPEAGKLFDEVIATPPADTPPNARAYLGAARVASVTAMYARERIMNNRAHALDPADPDIRRQWMQTLPKADRIKAIEEYLSQFPNDDADTRRVLNDTLAMLKASQRASLGACRLASDARSTQTGLRVLQVGGQLPHGSGVVAKINGQEASLLLDTLAPGIIVSSKFAARAGLKAIPDLRLAGVLDRPDAQATVASAPTIRIGDLEFQDCPVYVLDIHGQPDDGIIGSEAFSQFLLEMDFASSTLRLNPLPRATEETPPKPALQTVDRELLNEIDAKPSSDWPDKAADAARYSDAFLAPEMGNFIHAFLIGHRVLAPAKISDSAEKLFLLDSAAQDGGLGLDAARAIVKVHRAPRQDFRARDGELNKVYMADQVVLDFGHVRQPLTNIIIYDMSRFSRQAGTEISGDLSIAILTKLKVRLDYRDALIDFQYTKPTPRRR